MRTAKRIAPGTFALTASKASKSDRRPPTMVSVEAMESMTNLLAGEKSKAAALELQKQELKAQLVELRIQLAAMTRENNALKLDNLGLRVRMDGAKPKRRK